MRIDEAIERRIRALEREVAGGDAAGTDGATGGPDRRFVLGALHQRQGRPLDAARWYLTAARAAEGRGERAAARALVLLARDLAPTLLDALRAERRLASDRPDGMEG